MTDRPRTDGLYALKDEEGWSIVRFFDNHTVLLAATMPEERLSNVVTWMVPKTKPIDCVPVSYKLVGTHIHWVSPVSTSTKITFDGTLEPDHLAVGVVSTNGYTADRRYDFMSLTDIEAGTRKKSAAAKKKPVAKKPAKKPVAKKPVAAKKQPVAKKKPVAKKPAKKSRKR